MQPSRKFSEQCFWCWRSDTQYGGFRVRLCGFNACSSEKSLQYFYSRSGVFCPKGLPCSISGPDLQCKLRPKVRWPAILSQKKFPKLVSPLWCEKSGKLGDLKSKRILGFWASYMKSCGLRNLLGHLVTLCWLGSSDTSSTTPAGSGEPHHPLDKAFSSISWHQNLGTFYKEVSCVPFHATLPVILSTVWDQSKAFPPKADLHHLII